MVLKNRFGVLLKKSVAEPETKTRWHLRAFFLSPGLHIGIIGLAMSKQLALEDQGFESHCLHIF